MKKYTVQKVMKMEDKLHNMSASDLEDFLLPSMISFVVGGSITTTALTQAGALTPTSTAVVVISAAIAALGATKAARILMNDELSDNLLKKISQIYESMGEDFEKEVKNARESQQKHR